MCLSSYSPTSRQTPLDFLLNGKLNGEDIGLNTIPNYMVKVMHLKFLCSNGTRLVTLMCILLDCMRIIYFINIQNSCAIGSEQRKVCMSCESKTSVSADVSVCVHLYLYRIPYAHPRSSNFGMPQTRARIYFLLLRTDEGDDVGPATMDTVFFGLLYFSLNSLFIHFLMRNSS